MKVVGIEGSGSFLALCARAENATRAAFCSQEARQLSRLLIENLDETLSRAGWKLGEVEALCVGLGPGSWTSLRIVLSMVKTLAQTRQIPLAGVATFEAAARAALAQNQPASTRTGASPETSGGAILALAPSRANELYARLFRAPGGRLETLFEESVGAPEEIGARVLASRVLAGREDAAELLLCGVGAVPRDALSRLEATLARDFSVRFAAVSPEAMAEQIARLGAAKIARGEADDPLALLPIYVAPSAAERVREAKLAAAERN